MLHVDSPRIRKHYARNEKGCQKAKKQKGIKAGPTFRAKFRAQTRIEKKLLDFFGEYEYEYGPSRWIIIHMALYNRLLLLLG
jgi:hypothetical protein